MIGKLACWGATRTQAIARLRRALGETVVKGIPTNVAYLKRVLDLDEFRGGDYDTGLLAHAADRLKTTPPAEDRDLALAAAAIWQLEQDERAALSGAPAASSSDSPWSRAGRLATLRRSR
jgi:acetyl/propionyl-CoA carboxylase alpha subunit